MAHVHRSEMTMQSYIVKHWNRRTKLELELTGLWSEWREDRKKSLILFSFFLSFFYIVEYKIPMVQSWILSQIRSSTRIYLYNIYVYVCYTYKLIRSYTWYMYTSYQPHCQQHINDVRYIFLQHAHCITYYFIFIIFLCLL